MSAHAGRFSGGGKRQGPVPQHHELVVTGKAAKGNGGGSPVHVAGLGASVTGAVRVPGMKS